jgi:acyl-coenzyme A synthetase/AMP-(fatty) acid ligase
MNVVDPILHQCRWQPLALALCAPGTIFNAVTYSRLAEMVHNVGRHADEHGLARGQIVALLIKDPILHAVFILGLTRRGIVTASAREPLLPERLHVDAVLADAPYQLASGQSVTLVDKSWTSGSGAAPEDGARSIAAEHEPCRIILTSGTTGHPKAVIRTTRHVLARVQELQFAYGHRLPDCSRIFMNVGFATGLGHTFMMHTLMRGGTLYLPGSNTVESLAALSAHRLQAMIAAPKNLAEIAELCERTPILRGGLDVVISTGSLVTRALSERVRALLSTNFCCSYGSTEAGISATGPASEIARTEGAVGYVVPGVNIDIVDPSGQPLPAGQVGRVRVRRVHIADGYVGDSEDERRKFREEGFFPGDLGALTPNGMLVMHGREHAVINIGGDKVSPERIETALTAFAKVRDAAAFTIETAIGVRQVGCAIVWHGEPNVKELMEHLGKQLNPLFVPKLYIPVDGIPRNASGKIDRAGLNALAARRLAEGQVKG